MIGKKEKQEPTLPGTFVLNSKTILLGLIIGVPLAVIIFVLVVFPTAIHNPIRVSLEVPSTLSIDQSAVLRVHLKNTTKNIAEFYLGGNPAQSFILTDQLGREVWDSRKTTWVQDTLGNPKLQPGEEIVLETTITYESWNPKWDPYVYEPLPKKPGTYYVHARIKQIEGRPDLKSPRQVITIVK